MTLALEVHDAGLVIADENGPRAAPSPGYALLDGKDVVTGHAARERARLKPRHAHHRFWHDLNTTALPRPFPRDMSTADLAHAHLHEVWSNVSEDEGGVVLALPGWWSEEQLALALGIARACEIPVEGMVDASLASAMGFADARILHGELFLHHLVVTELRRDGDERVRRRLESDVSAGIVAVNDALARRISELFVFATRFDPLHSAAPEQELYRRLPEWLAELHEHEEIEITLTAGRKEHTITIARQDVAVTLEPLYDRVLELVRSLKRPGERGVLLLGPHLGALPGLEARLDRDGSVDWQVLEAGAASAGALACAAAVVAPGEEALPFVTRLPVAEGAARIAASSPSPPASVPAKPVERRTPTHLLHDGMAYAITDKPFHAMDPWSSERGNGSGHPPSCKIFIAGPEVIAEVPETADGRPAGVRLNGAEVMGRVILHVGDRLRVGPGERALDIGFIKVVG